MVDDDKGEELIEVPVGPNLGFGPGDRPEIQWFTLLGTGRIGAGARYVPSTLTGGLFVVAAGHWVCWSPITAGDFQKNVATVLNTLGQRWAARAKGAN